MRIFEVIPQDMIEFHRDQQDGIMIYMKVMDPASMVEEDTPHVTLAYLGKTSDYEDESAAKELITEQMESYDTVEFECPVASHAHFPEGEDGVPCVLIMSSSKLDDIRASMVEMLTDMGIEYSRKWGYVPHSTIMYHGPEDCPIEDEDLPESYTLRGPFLRWGDEIDTAAEPSQMLVLNSDPSYGFVWGVAYSPDEQDSWGTQAPAPVIRDSAWNYMLNHRQIGVGHLPDTEMYGDLVESSIYRGPSYVHESGQEIKQGAWLIGAIFEPGVFGWIKSTASAGFSMQGIGRLETIAASAQDPLTGVVLDIRGA